MSSYKNVKLLAGALMGVALLGGTATVHASLTNLYNTSEVNYKWMFGASGRSIIDKTGSDDWATEGSTVVDNYSFTANVTNHEAGKNAGIVIIQVNEKDGNTGKFTNRVGRIAIDGMKVDANGFQGVHANDMQVVKNSDGSYQIYFLLNGSNTGGKIHAFTGKWRADDPIHISGQKSFDTGISSKSSVANISRNRQGYWFISNDWNVWKSNTKDVKSGFTKVTGLRNNDAAIKADVMGTKNVPAWFINKLTNKDYYKGTSGPVSPAGQGSAVDDKAFYRIYTEGTAGEAIGGIVVRIPFNGGKASIVWNSLGEPYATGSHMRKIELEGLSFGTDGAMYANSNTKHQDMSRGRELFRLRAANYYGDDTAAPVFQLSNTDYYYTDQNPKDSDIIENLLVGGTAKVTDDISAFGLTYAIDKTKVNFKSPGSYPVTISATDLYGHKRLLSTNLAIKDRTVPNILVKTPTITVEKGAKLTSSQLMSKAGISATDDVKVSVIDATVTNVNWQKVGTTPVTITAKDSSGNVATSKVNIVIKDTKAPIINASDVTVEAGTFAWETKSLFSLAKATAVDEFGGKVNFTATTSAKAKSVGTGTITFTAVDESGNKSVKTVKFTQTDHTKPVINTKVDAITTKVGAKIDAAALRSQFGVTATDNVTGNVLISYNVASTVNTSKLGKQIVTITAKDAAGNVSTKLVTVLVGAM